MSFIRGAWSVSYSNDLPSIIVIRLFPLCCFHLALWEDIIASGPINAQPKICLPFFSLSCNVLVANNHKLFGNFWLPYSLLSLYIHYRRIQCTEEDSAGEIWPDIITTYSGTHARGHGLWSHSIFRLPVVCPLQLYHASHFPIDNRLTSRGWWWYPRQQSWYSV